MIKPFKKIIDYLFSFNHNNMVCEHKYLRNETYYIIERYVFKKFIFNLIISHTLLYLSKYESTHLILCY